MEEVSNVLDILSSLDIQENNNCDKPKYYVLLIIDTSNDKIKVVRLFSSKERAINNVILTFYNDYDLGDLVFIREELNKCSGLDGYYLDKAFSMKMYIRECCIDNGM